MLGKAECLKFTKRVRPLDEADRKRCKRKKDARARIAEQRSRRAAYEHWSSHIQCKPNHKPQEFS